MIVLSLGAGVQSSTLYLMAVRGELVERPVAAIFADTMAEPSGVYQWLDYLEAQGGSTIPIIRCSQGDLTEDVLGAVEGRNKRCSQPPFHVINRAGLDGRPPDTGGQLWRNCTVDFKLAPLRRAVRAVMKEHGAKTCRQWIGISLDEAHRMKPSGVKYISNEYPLVDLRMSRQDCLAWMERHGYPRPPKSACVYCPYRSNGNWIRFREEQPEDYAKAVDFDRRLRAEGRRLPGVLGEAYVHRRLLPLDEAIDSTMNKEQMTLDLPDVAFGNECTGMCGV